MPNSITININLTYKLYNPENNVPIMMGKSILWPSRFMTHYKNERSYLSICARF